MARIVLGIGCSHSPAIQLSPKEWELRAVHDRKRKHWYRGAQTTYEEMLDARAAENLAAQCTFEEMERRHEACQQALAHLRATLKAAAPDVCVIVGDDQYELFDDENMPPFSIYIGESMDDGPRETTPEEKALGFYDTELGNPPAARTTHPGEPLLGSHLIESMKSSFDVSYSKKLPQGTREGLIGHAFYFIYRRLMNNTPIPNVPVFINTYFSPNQPSMRRCYAFGEALRTAIESWPSDKRVAIFASGGLSHFIVDEELDQRIISGLREKDPEKLTGLPDNRFNSGTSEVRNWVAVGGALARTTLSMRLVDYIPCYRTAAGTGFGACFAEWL